MSDTPLSPEPSPDVTGAPAAPEHDLVVDPAAFLPEGTSFAVGDEGDEEDGGEGMPTADVTEDHDVDDVTRADRARPTEADEPGPQDAAAPTPEPAPKEPPVDLAALGQIEADLGAVDAALLALDQGRYGTCTACDQPIGDALLAADPVRTTCEAHTPA